jgi:hypothetical protein
MKPALFTSPGIRIESRRDHNGRIYLAWKPHASMWFNDRRSLLRWLAWPIKTPTGDALRAWLDELESSDQQRQQPKADGLSSELLATGFGPEVHDLDASDPNHPSNCKMVI